MHLKVKSWAYSGSERMRGMYVLLPMEHRLQKAWHVYLAVRSALQTFIHK